MPPPMLLLVAILACAAGVERAPNPPAASWSPDGAWLAYAIDVRPLAEPTEAPWAIPSAGLRRQHAALSPTSPTLVRLYATRADGSSTVMLDEVLGGVSAPCWSANGRSLIYLRWVGAGFPRSRVEAVALAGPGRDRVVWSTTLLVPPPIAVLADIPALSPDGRRLAIPVPDGGGVKVLDMADSRVRAELPGSARPSWSPDGRLLAFAKAGRPADEILVYDDRSGGTRSLIAAPGATALPRASWVDGGRTLLVAREAPSPEGLRETELVRVRVADGLAENVRPSLSNDAQPYTPDPTLWGPSFAVAGDDLYTGIPVRGKPSQLARGQLATGGIAWKSPVMDVAFSIQVLGVYSGSETTRLALAFSGQGGRSLVAVCESSPSRGPTKLRPLVPDDDARDAWIEALVGRAVALLRDELPAATLGGKVVERPTILPLPGEFPADNPLIERLQKLARWGRPLCDPPALGRRAAEARVFFDILLGDHRGALEGLDAAMPGAGTPAARSTWLALRAQSEIGVGDLARARATIAYLRQLQPERPGRVELKEMPSGATFSAIPRRDDAWVDLLQRAADAASKAKHEPADDPKKRPRPRVAPDDARGFDPQPRPFVHVEPR